MNAPTPLSDTHAHGLRRRYAREVEALPPIPEQPLTGRRKRSLEACLKTLAAQPETVQLAVQIRSARFSKRPVEATVIYATMEDGRWYLTVAWLGRRGQTEVRDIADLSDHFVERAMQFTRTTNVKDALFALRTGLTTIASATLDSLPIGEFIWACADPDLALVYRNETLVTTLRLSDRLGTGTVFDALATFPEPPTSARAARSSPAHNIHHHP